MRIRSLAVLLLSSTPAFTQSVTSLRGRVTDSSNAVVPGAHVSLTSATTGAVREQVTGGEGGYEFPQMQPGKYLLRVSASGFQSVTKDQLELLVATPMTVDITLSVASTQQQVNVSGDAPVVNTVDATLGNAFDERQVNALPLEGRNVVELLSLQPGVTFLGK